ncbi:hypothetical protein ACU635_43210 [[Actinomadura] parvosata]|uniref:hypothetical protein n=1 Tax=[Actinomadura] parvosata TaxID=1955412 RepID=UPI00406D0EEA
MNKILLSENDATTAVAERSPLINDGLYGVSGALATLTVITFVVAAVTGRTSGQKAVPASPPDRRRHA